MGREREVGRARRPDYPQIGDRLRIRRRERGLSLRDLAERLGVSPSLISQIERGRANPSVSTLYSIVGELDISLDELLFNERRPGEAEQGVDGELEDGVVGAPGAVAPEGVVPRTRGRATSGAVARPGRSVAATAAGAPGSPGSAGQSEQSGPADEAGHDHGRASVMPVQRAALRKHIRLASGVIWERLTTVSEPGVEFLYVIYEVGGASSDQDAFQRHAGHEWGYVISGELHVAIGFDEYLLEPGDAISIDSRIPHRLANLGDTPVHAIWFVLGRVPVDQGEGEEPPYTPSTERRTRPSARSSSERPSRTIRPSDSR